MEADGGLPDGAREEFEEPLTILLEEEQLARQRHPQFVLAFAGGQDLPRSPDPPYKRTDD